MYRVFTIITRNTKQPAVTMMLRQKFESDKIEFSLNLYTTHFFKLRIQILSAEENAQ